MTNTESKTPRGVMITTIVLGIVILIPSMAGFVNKLFEFTNVVKGDADGAFALTPIVNYLMASAGFFCFLIWSTMQGMFHDIEAPKQRMLDREEMLDAGIRTHVPAWAGGHDLQSLSGLASPSKVDTRLK